MPECRFSFGDPETQVVLPLLKSDLLEIMMATSSGRLSECEVEFSTDSCACVIMASRGYPEKYESGYPIDVPADIRPYVYVAGARLSDGKLVSAGGRVLGVTATASELSDALAIAYERVGKIGFDNAFYRKDIGQRALMAKKG